MLSKRCALSSSSGASDPLRKLRPLKRGVVVLPWRGGGAASPGSSRRMSESSWNRHCRGADGMHSSVSVRKLVNSLWLMHDGELVEEEGIARDAAARRGSVAHRRCASSVETSKRSRTKSKALNGDDEWFSDMRSNGGTMEVHTQDMSSTGSDDRMAHLQDMYNCLSASKELVRVLASILGRGELNPSTASLLSALRSELDLARAHTRQLVKGQRRQGDEVELLKKRLSAEAHEWKSRQREKVAATVKVVVAELDGERRSKRRAERVNAKLGKALAETESSLQAATRELERERRSRERLEKVCDELVRGGASTAEVEEIRRAQEELGKEREMLRLADELREERVQMKLLEARLQFEEKNAVVEQLRGELEAFLEIKKDHQESPAAAADEHRAIDDDHSQLLLAPHSSEGAHGNGIACVSVSRRSAGEDDDDEEGGADDDDDESEGSDMHSIELNIDGNGKDCGWSYTAASKEMTTMSSKKAPSFSASDRGTECAADPWAGVVFDRRSTEGSEGGQWDVDEGCSDRTRDDLDEDSERYEAIKNLREQMLAGHGFVFLSQADGGNAESEQHRSGLIC